VKPHEQFIPTDDEQRFAAMILERAKTQWGTAGDFEPVAFLVRQDGEIAALALGDLGNFNDSDNRGALWRALRAIVQIVQPRCVAIASDSWMTVFDQPAVDAAGLDPLKYRRWTDEQRAKYAERTEALLVSFGTKDRAFVITQVYRRDHLGKPVFEETHYMPEMSGRMRMFGSD
jgi:hypothetical protein